MNNKKEYLILFAYNLRQNLPNSHLFYSLYVFAKFISLILISHNVSNLEDNVHNLSNFFISLTLFGKGYKRYISSYLSVLVVFFFTIVGIFLLTLFTIFLIKSNHGHLLYGKLTKAENNLIKVIAYTFTFLAFFSQHLIEYFTLGIVDVVLPNFTFLGNNSPTVDYIFLSFCITNVILSEATSIGFFYLTKSFSSDSPIGDPNIFTFSSSDLLSVVLTSMQGIFALHNINETSESYHYYLNLFLSIVLVFHVTLQFKRYNYYDTNYSLFFERFLFYFCFISSLDEIVLCHLCKTPFTQSYSFCKITLELLNAFIFTKLNIMYINSSYMEGFIKKVFSDKLKLSPFELLSYVREITKFKDQEVTFSNIFQIFSYHKEHCSLPKCSCHYLSVAKWINQVKAAQGEINEKEVVNKSYHDFVILGEYEINKMIVFYHKTKQSRSTLDSLIILHIDYMLNVKKQLCQALYLTSQYLITNNEKMSFLTQLTLYEFKLLIFNRLTKEKRKAAKKELNTYISIDVDETLENYDKINLFYHHTVLLEKIRLLLITCCESLSNILDFSKTIEAKTTGLQKKCEYFFKLCQNYQEKHNELVDILSKTKSKIKHYEISYMLSTYFLSSICHIPEKIKNAFKNIDTYSYFTFKHKDGMNSYKQFNKINPMMIFINSNDEFIIKYISISLCSQLNYKRQELMNSEFNTLLPKEFIPMHNIVLKKFVLGAKKAHKSNSYIFDKEKNMLPAKFEFQTILTLDNNFGILISVDMSYKESPNERDYYLLLDKDMMFISMNKAFPENFYFTLPIFQLLKLNFCTFFGINQERITMKAKNMFNSSNSGSSSNKANNSSEEYKVLTVFAQRKSETMFTDMKAAEINNYVSNSKKIYIHDSIAKKGIIKNLDNINKMIEELGLDIEWYSRVNCLRERLELMKSQEIETNYSIVNIEDLTYIIVNLKERKDLTLRTSMENTFNMMTMTMTKSNFGESNCSLQKYNNSKLKSNRSIANSDNMDMSSTSKLRVSTINTNSSNANNIINTNSNHLHHLSIGFQPNQSVKRDATVTSGSLVNSMLTLNKTSIVLLNSSDNNIKRNGLNSKDFSFSPYSYETRELFSCKIVQKYLHHSYKLLGLCIFILSLLFLIYNSSYLNQARDLYYLTFYSLMMKSNIYVSSLEILESCERAEANETDKLKEEREDLLALANEMIDQFTLFSKTLNSLVKSPITKIFDLINTDNDYKKMMQNFDTVTKSTEIYDELFFIHYYLIQLSEDSSFESCRLKKVFIKKNYENLINTVPGPNYEETIVYYIINNILFSITAKMEELTETTFKIIKLHFKTSQSSILLFNCLLLLLCILLGVSFVLIIQYNKTNMQILLNMIYSKYSIEDKFEKEIKAFRLVFEEFSSENCMKYEDIKKSTTNKRLSTELSLEKKIEKRKKSRINRMSSVMNIDNNSIHKVKRYSKKLTTPKQVKFSVCITLVFIALFIIIISINMFLSKSLYDNLMFAIVISINFINRIPKVCELYLYTKISIILNDVYFIKTPIDNYNNSTYLNYYNITLDTESNSLFTLLKDSEFSFLYYQLHQIQGNIEHFIGHSKKTSVLKQLTEWEHLFNSKEGLCIYGALGHYSISYHDANNVQIINSISTDVTKCRMYGNGMTMNSLNAYIEFSTQTLKNLYLDFANTNPLTRDPIVSLSNGIFSSLGSITTGPLKSIHDTIMYYIASDLSKICTKNKLVSLIVALLLMFLCLGVFLYVHFFLIQQIEKNINTLTFIQGINVKVQS